MLSTEKQSSGETADPSVPTSIATRRATAKPGADSGQAKASGHIALATTLWMAGSPAGYNKLARRFVPARHPRAMLVVYIPVQVERRQHVIDISLCRARVIVAECHASGALHPAGGRRERAGDRAECTRNPHPGTGPADTRRGARSASVRRSAGRQGERARARSVPREDAQGRRPAY